jgi:hypothetical protein
MKSKSTTFLLVIVVLAVIGGALYYVSQSSTAPATPTTGLVSTNTGAATGIPAVGTPTNATGQQVVNLLRSLSTIQLSDAVFQNPTFSLLQDMSIALPPVTNPGRRNPFAPIGNDTGSATVSSDLLNTDAVPAGIVDQGVPVTSKTTSSKTGQ